MAKMPILRLISHFGIIVLGVNPRRFPLGGQSDRISVWNFPLTALQPNNYMAISPNYCPAESEQEELPHRQANPAPPIIAIGLDTAEHFMDEPSQHTGNQAQQEDPEKAHQDEVHGLPHRESEEPSC